MIFYIVVYIQIFPVAQMVKNLPTMQETSVRSLGQEDPLEKGMATHCSIFAWRIPWREEPGGLQFVGSQRVGHDWATNTASATVYNVNPNLPVYPNSSFLLGVHAFVLYVCVSVSQIGFAIGSSVTFFKRKLLVPTHLLDSELCGFTASRIYKMTFLKNSYVFLTN